MLTFREYPAQMRAVQLTSQNELTPGGSQTAQILLSPQIGTASGDVPPTHLHDRKMFLIGSMSLADQHALRRDNIHWNSLAHLWFRLYKLRSLLANLRGYTKLLNLTACFHDMKSHAA